MYLHIYFRGNTNCVLLLFDSGASCSAPVFYHYKMLLIENLCLTANQIVISVPFSSTLFILTREAILFLK